MAVHSVLDHELTTLQSPAYLVNLTFFGITAGAAISFGAVVLTQTASSRGHSTFVALFWAAATMALYFAISSYRSWRQSRDLVRQIRRRPGG